MNALKLDDAVRANWQMFDSAKDCYDKIELYSDVFKSVSPDSKLVVSGQFGGPVLVLDSSTVTVLSSSGEIIREKSRWNLNIGQVLTAGWSDDTEDVVFVMNDGQVHLYSMFGIFKSTFSMGQEAKDVKLKSAKIFPSLKGTGVAVLTTQDNFYVVQNTLEPRCRKLPMHDCGVLDPNSWCPLVRDKQERLVVAGDTLVLLSLTDKTGLEGLEVLSSARCKFVVTSPSQARACAVLDNGLVCLVEIEPGAARRIIRTHDMGEVPRHVVWCGEEAVLLVGSFMTTFLHASGETDPIFFDDPPLCVVQEMDGVRILCAGSHQLIHKVAKSVQELCMIGSVHPGTMLLMASHEVGMKSHKADEYIRMIQDRGHDCLPRAVSDCISAAGELFNPDHQKEFLKAAKFGTAFLKAEERATTRNFYETCKMLKIRNNVRHNKVGIPLTQHQLEAMSIKVLIDRLIARRHFKLALEVADFLKLAPGEGASRVKAHWALYKVETSGQDDAAVDKEISQQLQQDPDISYSDIAERAAECKKPKLAQLLLEHEMRAHKRVPLLMKLAQDQGANGNDFAANALKTAIDSGDTDMIYHVLLALQEKNSSADFHMIVRKNPVASKLYSLYCGQNQDAGASLEDWYRQEDDHSGLARLRYAESYSTGNLPLRLASLVTAQEQFSRARDEFGASVAKENHQLLKHQSGLEEKLGKPFLNLSLHDTLKRLVESNEVKLADSLKSEFKLSDRKYFWIKVRAYGDSQQWSELSKLAKSKKTSPIGFAPFIDQCLKHNEKGHASKYLPLLTQEERLRYSVKLNLLQEAAEAAFALRNMEALSALEIKASRNVSLLETIAGYKQRLQLSSK